MPLMGQRVLLRALEVRDLEPIWEAYKDFDMMLLTDGDAPPLTDRQVRAFWAQRIDSPAPEMRYFAVEPLPGQPFAGQFAGLCNLHDIDARNRHAELALWLAAVDMRGQGFGTDAIRTLLPYAFDVVRLDKLYLGVYDFNEGAIRSYERVGFRYEGRLRQTIFYQGRYWDDWPMRLLRSEWDVIRQPPRDGLRPFHPNDLDAALELVQRQAPTPDKESARTILRRWWRRIDLDVYSFQLAGNLAGICALTTENGRSIVVESLIEESHQTAWRAAVSISFPTN
jgi:RimJ/RimL family protein N-acetyltransferase